MSARFIPPITLICMSICIFVATLLLHRARLGNPTAPLWFPIIISIFMFIVSLTLLYHEWKKRHQSFDNFKALKVGRTPRLILGTLLLCLIYSLIFDRITFVISTTLFLGAELFLLNGYKKWMTNSPVAIIFTGIVWLGFTQLLGINLP